MSVYDLRDHPDFRYRPGSVVIRVANFEENQNCYTGQVLDNFPSGEVCSHLLMLIYLNCKVFDNLAILLILFLKSEPGVEVMVKKYSHVLSSDFSYIMKLRK